MDTGSRTLEPLRVASGMARCLQVTIGQPLLAGAGARKLRGQGHGPTNKQGLGTSQKHVLLHTSTGSALQNTTLAGHETTCLDRN
jgi:hypothetical protein